MITTSLRYIFKRRRREGGQPVAFPGEVIVFCGQVYCFVTFSLTLTFSNTPQSLMSERTSVHVQNQN